MLWWASVILGSIVWLIAMRLSDIDVPSWRYAVLSSAVYVIGCLFAWGTAR